MVTGHSPFQGDSATTVCFKVANREPVPASALDLNLPTELDVVIARAMAKDPARRYQRGAEFAEAVGQLQAQRQTGSTTTSFVTTLGTTTRKAAPGQSLRGNPAMGLAYAAKLLRAEILKAPAKDLILVVATVILLSIVGVQSKLLFNTREEAADPGQLHAAPVPTQPAIASHVAASVGTSASAKGNGSAANVAATTKPAARKASAKAHAKVQPTDSVASAPPPAPEPAKQVVVSLSTVELAVRHQFKEATLSVWVDEKLALTRPLHGGTQKRLVVFSGVRGIESETLKVPAGKHTLRLRTHTADQTVDLSRTISEEFIGGNDKTLQISFDKHNTSMHLEWQ
jgi:hypothetical protein